MNTQDPTTLSRKDVDQITNLARTLLETSKDLARLCNRRHPNLDQAKWMINLAVKNCTGVLSRIGVFH